MTTLEKIIISLVIANAALILSGCGLFIRDIDAWGFKMTFPEGLDASVGANSVDRVDNRRGVSPVIEQRTKQQGGKY